MEVAPLHVLKETLAGSQINPREHRVLNQIQLTVDHSEGGADSQRRGDGPLLGGEQPGR
jgi:hypothetical protein